VKITVTTNKEPELVIPESHINNVISTMGDWYGVHLTKEHVLKLMEKSNKALSIILEYSENGYDTADREWLISEIAEYVTDNKHCDWPCNGDSKDTKEKFYKDFFKGAEEKNIKLDWKIEEMTN
jgi:hypothetical protein